LATSQSATSPQKEGNARDLVLDRILAAHGREITQAKLAHHIRQIFCSPSTGRSETAWMDTDLSHCLQGTIHDFGLFCFIQPGPDFMAPAVDTDLPSRIGDCPQRVGIDVCIPAFDEKSNRDVAQMLEKRGHGFYRRVMLPNRLTLRPSAHFQIGSFAQIVEGKTHGGFFVRRAPAAFASRHAMTLREAVFVTPAEHQQAIA